PEHARVGEHPGTGPIAIAADDPLAALQRLARAWRGELGCPVVGVTGSTGKTSTKDILSALLRQRLPRTHANRENLNTEIGLPLTILEAERGTDAMVLEMAMRGMGQIAELVAIAEPDAGLIVKVGPVHLEVLGTGEWVAAATALGVEPGGSLDVRFSSLRGEVVELEGGVTVVNDCYNANPMSMRAALEHLAATPAERRVAVLGTMAELGSDAERYHREIG